MQYNLSAAEILKVLGYDKPVGKETLKGWMQELGTTFPKVYCDFMELAMDCEMLETSDLWVGKMINFVMKPWFLYEELKEQIEESIYLSFAQLPEERWGELCSDYLKIGSDYGAGIVDFAILREDLELEDPPVYINHEANAITEWEKMYEKLSDYLLEVVLNALNCKDYETAMEALEEKGYCYHDYEDYMLKVAEEGTEESDDLEDILEEDEWQAQMLKASGIDLSKVYKRNGNYETNKVFCCYNEEKKHLYIGNIEDEEISLVLIYKKG